MREGRKQEASNDDHHFRAQTFVSEVLALDLVFIGQNQIQRNSRYAVSCLIVSGC